MSMLRRSVRRGRQIGRVAEDECGSKKEKAGVGKEDNDGELDPLRWWRPGG